MYRFKQTKILSIIYHLLFSKYYHIFSIIFYLTVHL